MSIHFITGNPGGGKGLLSVQKICDELVNDERPIITNLPVRIEPWVRVWRRFGKTHHKAEIGFRQYLVQKYGKDFGIRERLFFIEDQLVPEFFLWRRGPDGKLFRLESKSVSGIVEEYDTTEAVNNGGVCYVTDEAWRFWNSRKWQKTGTGLQFYSAQHRHLGDTWYIVTQKTAQCDKALHRVAQDFSVVTNQGKLPLGMFNRPDVFTVSVYDEAPTGTRLDPIKRSVFRLDKKGLGSCYDTSAGTGIGGGSGADLNERKSGLPWWGILVLLFLFCLGAWKLPLLFGRLVTSPLRGKPVPAQIATSDPVVADRISATAGRPGGSPGAAPASLPDVLPDPVYVTGSCVLGGRLSVFLSDGRICEGADVQAFQSGRAKIGGVWHERIPPRKVGSGVPREAVTQDPLPGVRVEKETAPSVVIYFGRRDEGKREVPEMLYPVR